MQINARTELALRYNDISPLENHHCSVAFRILELQECNILSALPPAAFRTVREGIIRCILATDMARHNEILAQFKDITPEFDFSNKSHTDLVRVSDSAAGQPVCSQGCHDVQPVWHIDVRTAASVVPNKGSVRSPKRPP